MMRHFQNSLFRHFQAYSGTFTNIFIQTFSSVFGEIHQYSVMFRGNQGRQDITRHIQALLSRTWPYSVIFIALCNPYMYNCTIFRPLAYLERQVSSKACGTPKISGISRALAQSVQFFQTFSRLFWKYSELLMHIQLHSPSPENYLAARLHSDIILWQNAPS